MTKPTELWKDAKTMNDKKLCVVYKSSRYIPDCPTGILHESEWCYLDDLIKSQSEQTAIIARQAQ